MLTKEDLKYCLQHYPEVAEHITTVAIERYQILKAHEQSAIRRASIVDHSNKSDQPNQNQHDDQEGSKQSCFNQWLIINPESHFGLTVSAIGHILVLFTSLILPYQVN